MQSYMSTIVASGRPVGRGKSVSGPVVGAGVGLANLRARVARAADQHGVDRRVMAECPGVGHARVIGAAWRGPGGGPERVGLQDLTPNSERPATARVNASRAASLSPAALTRRCARQNAHLP